MSIEKFEHFNGFEDPSNPADKESKPADGTEVGVPDSQKLELSDKKDEKSEKPIISPEEYKEKKDVAMQKVENAKAENPDWPPAKGNPEAEEKLAGDLEAGLNNA